MTFEWDEDKNKINLEKHGIDFETAMLYWFLMICKESKSLIWSIVWKRTDIIRSEWCTMFCLWFTQSERTIFV